MQARNQEIVDTQMLRLVELKRELEVASAEADRARVAAETANREAVAKLGQRVEQQQPRPQPVQPEQPRPQPVRRDPTLNDIDPEFAAIEAVLAGSPPVPAWERTA